MSTNNGNASAGTSASSPSLSAYINLSNYMYHAFDTPYSSTKLQQEIGFAPFPGIPVESIDYATGLYAEAFLSTGNGVKQVVIAYEGTQLGGAAKQGLGFSSAEIIDDAQLFAGEKANSLDEAATFAQNVTLYAKLFGVSSQNVYVTGHSLGAAEADYAASQTGLGGVTFAAPGISTAYTGVYPNVANAGKVVNYVDGGDPIGNYAADAPDTLASVLTSNTIKHYGGDVVLPNAGGQNTLRDAAAAYARAKSLNSTTKEDAALASAIVVNGHDHLLPQYAQDVGYLANNGKPLSLYLPDGSTSAALGYFPSAKSGASYGSVDPSWIASATTAGGSLHSQSASILAGHESPLAVSSDRLAQALAITSHHLHVG